LIQQDRKDLADLTHDFSTTDKGTRANRADKATNQGVIMMINGANAVIHPPLQQNVDEGVERVVESIHRMKTLADEFDRLKRMSFEDLAYPSIFDQTFNRFIDLWEHESSWLPGACPFYRDSQAQVPGPRRRRRAQGGETLPLTLSQRMKQLLEQAEEMMSKAKISSPTSGDKKKAAQARNSSSRIL
ncbi:hypothetical protein CPB97_000112, partial [Podila verticillata]